VVVEKGELQLTAAERREKVNKRKAEMSTPHPSTTHTPSLLQMN